MKKNIEMVVTKLYEKPIIYNSDIISEDVIKNEFNYNILNADFKYLFQYIHDIYCNIHQYIIYIFMIILVLIFIFQCNKDFDFYYYLYN
jgi:hypothetical protein